MNENELKTAVQAASGMKILVIDAQSRENACEFLKEVKRRMKEVVDFFAESKKKAAEAHKAICANEKSLLDPLKAAEAEARNAIGAFDLAERRRMEAEEERRRQEAAAAMELAAEAEQSGDVSGAAEAVAMAAMESAQMSYAPKTAGVSTRFEWRARVVDAEKVPRHFLIVDEKALNAFAKATKGKTPVAGVEFYEAPVISTRTR